MNIPVETSWVKVSSPCLLELENLTRVPGLKAEDKYFYKGKSMNIRKEERIKCYIPQNMLEGRNDDSPEIDVELAVYSVRVCTFISRYHIQDELIIQEFLKSIAESNFRK